MAASRLALLVLLAAVVAVANAWCVFDGHNDLPMQYRARSYQMDSLDLSKNLSGIVHTDLVRLRASATCAQFWSVYVGCIHQDADAVRAVMEQIDAVKQFVALYPNDLQLAVTSAEVDNAIANGRIASLIGAEGGHAIDNSLGALRMFYDLGVRYMTLTHVCNNQIADSRPGPPVFNGLSEFGERVVLEMNRIGMIVDIAHTSQDTMRHTLRVAKAPLILSHNCAYALTSFIGAAPDDVLVALRENGGVLMVIFIQGCVEPRYGARITVRDIADHIEHIAAVAGIEHVGLGADYDGAADIDFPADMQDVSSYPVLAAELTARGWSEAQLDLVFSGNIRRVLRQVEAVAADLQRTSPPDNTVLPVTNQCRYAIPILEKAF